jgi:hypothetical protein
MDVITHMKVGRLKWAGHLIQMNDQQPAKRVFTVEQDGSRVRRRPCNTCADNIDRDICTVGEIKWNAIAVNPENW